MQKLCIYIWRQRKCCEYIFIYYIYTKPKLNIYFEIIRETTTLFYFDTETAQIFTDKRIWKSIIS